MIKQKKHSWVIKNIVRYIDGDLAENEKINYFNHINSCKSCLDAHKKIENLLKDGYSRHVSPNYLWERVRASTAGPKSSGINDNLSISKYKFSYIIIIVIIVLTTFFGNAFVFDKHKYITQGINAEEVFPISADDFSNAVELSLLQVIDYEK